MVFHQLVGACDGLRAARRAGVRKGDAKREPYSLPRPKERDYVPANEPAQKAPWQQKPSATDGSYDPLDLTTCDAVRLHQLTQSRLKEQYKLPIAVLLKICQMTVDKQTLARLAVTCRALAKEATHQLWRHNQVRPKKHEREGLGLSRASFFEQSYINATDDPDLKLDARAHRVRFLEIFNMGLTNQNCRLKFFLLTCTRVNSLAVHFSEPMELVGADIWRPIRDTLIQSPRYITKLKLMVHHPATRGFLEIAYLLEALPLLRALHIDMSKAPLVESGIRPSSDCSIQPFEMLDLYSLEAIQNFQSSLEPLVALLCSCPLLNVFRFGLSAYPSNCNRPLYRSIALAFPPKLRLLQLSNVALDLSALHIIRSLPSLWAISFSPHKSVKLEELVQFLSPRLTMITLYRCIYEPRQVMDRFLNEAKSPFFRMSHFTCNWRPRHPNMTHTTCSDGDEQSRAWFFDEAEGRRFMPQHELEAVAQNWGAQRATPTEVMFSAQMKESWTWTWP